MAALKQKWASLHAEFQKSSHKRFMSELQARRQQELDAEMKRVEAYLLRLNYDLVYYLTN